MGEFVPWPVPENSVETEAVPELLGGSEPTELPENCREGVGAPEVLGLPEIVWGVETV